MYRLDVSPRADQDLEKLKKHIRTEDYERVRAAIRGLASEPRPHGVQKIRGSELSYRLRVGSYRIVYEIHDDKLLILLVQVSRRNERTYMSWRKRFN